MTGTKKIIEKNPFSKRPFFKTTYQVHWLCQKIEIKALSKKMVEKRKLNWECNKDLLNFSDVVKSSIDSSMEYIDSKCPTSALKVGKSFIHEDLMERALEALKNTTNHDPMLIVSLSAKKVEILLVYILGPKLRQLMIVDKSDVRDCYKYRNSAERFFAHIAENCYKITNNNAHCFGPSSAGKTVLCTIISHFPNTQNSLTSAKIENFNDEFYLPNCEGKDLVKMFNQQLKDKQDPNIFSVNCTAMLNFSVSAMAGDFLTGNEPNVLVSASHGSCNICLIETLPAGLEDLPGPKMIINTGINKFGSCPGLMEHDLLKRFSDSTLDNIAAKTGDGVVGSENKSDLLTKFVDGHHMVRSVKTFLKLRLPNDDSRFLWIDCPNSINEEHISDLLEYVEMGSNLRSRLIQLYNELDANSRRDMSILCKVVRDRSAKMLAAMVFGTLKRAAKIRQQHLHRERQRKCYKTKMMVSLAGSTMLKMHGYRQKFEATLNQLRLLEFKKRGVDSKLDFDCQNVHGLSSIYGAVAIGKYVGKLE